MEGMNRSAEAAPTMPALTFAQVLADKRITKLLAASDVFGERSAPNEALLRAAEGHVQSVKGGPTPRLDDHVKLIAVGGEIAEALLQGRAFKARAKKAKNFARRSEKLGRDVAGFFAADLGSYLDLRVRTGVERGLPSRERSDFLPAIAKGAILDEIASVLRDFAEVAPIRTTVSDVHFGLACDLWQDQTGKFPTAVTNDDKGLVYGPALDFLAALLEYLGWPRKSLTATALKGRLGRLRERRGL